jgi:class 3 adenylate cyclase
MTQVADDPLQAGREAAARGAYREAYDLLNQVESPEAEDLERLAEAAYWTGRLDEAIGFRERAYAAYSAAAKKPEAALVAIWLSLDYFAKASLSVSGGWFSKAKRLLEDEEESPANGYLAFAGAANLMMTGKLDEAIVETDRALAVAKRFSDHNLDAMARVVKGRSLVLKGETDLGLELLDEATAAATSGELDPLSTGLVYCITITSAYGVGDYRRAAEWSDVANRWCDRQDVTGFPGACRVHHASVERLRGNWNDAEEQALQACEELQGYDAWTTAAGFYEIGEIRRRRGDFAQAEEAYAAAKEWGLGDPQPGLALLRLAQGKVDAAISGIRRALGNSKDPIGRLRRLPAHVAISVQAGNLKEARDAARELEELVDAMRVSGERTPAFDATVCYAWAQIDLADNDLDGAAGRLEKAVETWRSVGAPYEVAQAQMLLGLTLRRLGHEDGARDELKAARAAFERLGAVLDVQRTLELLGEAASERTFMFTDLVDSTKLVEAVGEEKWQTILAWHDTTLKELIEKESGEVIKQTGDGYFAAFRSPASALRAAVAIQQALRDHPGVVPDVRIGIHTGGAFHRADDDYAGQGVNIAARIGALAAGGEILVSRKSVNGSPYRLSEPRVETLKGVEGSVELVAVDWR